MFRWDEFRVAKQKPKIKLKRLPPGRKKIKIPVERVIELRNQGYSLKEICSIIAKETGVYPSRTTVWRRIKEVAEFED